MTIRACVICGDGFHPKERGQRACGRECGAKLQGLVRSGRASKSETYSQHHDKAHYYGNTHKRLRERWAKQVERGQVCCARCGRLIVPGTPWDLDHTQDRGGYLGPSHARCNRATATRRRRRRQLPAWWPVSER